LMLIQVPLGIYNLPTCPQYEFLTCSTNTFSCDTNKGCISVKWYLLLSNFYCMFVLQICPSSCSYVYFIWVSSSMIVPEVVIFRLCPSLGLVAVQWFLRKDFFNISIH
jgi:hypothetical protein